MNQQSPNARTSWSRLPTCSRGSKSEHGPAQSFRATVAPLKGSFVGLAISDGCLERGGLRRCGSVFLHTGPTSIGGQTVNVANSNVLRSFAGVGPTWVSPFGALAINYAVPVRKAAYDVAQPS